jgi:hypothetical protein
MAAHLRSAASFSAALATLSAASADAQAAGRTDLLLRIQGLRGNVLSRQGIRADRNPTFKRKGDTPVCLGHPVVSGTCRPRD